MWILPRSGVGVQTLLSIDGEREQDVARLAADERVAGIDEHHAADDDRAGSVE